MFDISPVQIVLVLAVALLVFGPRRLPEMGRGLGRGLRDFRDGLSGRDETGHAADDAEPVAASSAAQPDPAATRLG